jgi:hypothetical protein
MLSSGKSTAGSDLSGDVNILGMQFLGEGLVQTMEKLVHERIGHPSSTPEVIVTGQGSTFGVIPKHPVVWSLKDAIKEYGMWHIPAFKIKIKSPDGEVLGDEDVLQAGVKYQFELPETKRY